MMRSTRSVHLASCVIASFAGFAWANQPAAGPALNAPTSFGLSQADPDDKSTPYPPLTTTWDIEGPVEMRAADVQEASSFDIKNIIDYSTSSDGSDDDFVYRFALEWGFIEDHELDLVLPVNLGDGRYEGNADITLGWQWKLLDEDGWIPAIAVYNSVRLPTGYHSSGADWELRGIFTKTLVEDSLRLHVNPFLRTMDTDNLESNLRAAGSESGGWWWFTGDSEKSGRHFAAGGIVGLDYRLTESATVNFDYILDSGRLDGYSMQHSMEAGIDYQLTASQTLGWAARWTMDGDSQGDNFGFGLSWIIWLDDLFDPVGN